MGQRHQYCQRPQLAKSNHERLEKSGFYVFSQPSFAIASPSESPKSKTLRPRKIGIKPSKPKISLLGI